jgi:hypothetical protein
MTPTLTNRPLSSLTVNDDDSDDADTDSPFTPRTEDTHAATRSSPYPPTQITTLPTPTDDEQKQLRRPYYPFGLSHQPHRMTQEYSVIFDARAATTQESDSSSNHPDHIDSDEDYPGYWPERRKSPPPRTNSPPVSTISDPQLADWARSQLPWHTFRHRIPELRNIPDALCGPPHIPRLYPPHQYMLANQHGTPDQLGVSDRTSHFYNTPNNDTWSQYLATLPPMVRQYYNTLPPSLYAYPLHTSTSNKPRAPRLGGYSRSSDPTSNQTIPRKRHRTTPPTSDSDPEGYSRNNQPYDAHRLSQPTSIPPPSNIAESKRSSEEAHYGRSNSGARPRFAHEGKSTPHLRPCLN